VPWSCLATALLLACGGAGLLPEGVHHPPEIQDACHRVEQKCSGCHALERVQSAHRRGQAEWQQQVKQMRLKPASGITEADAAVIVTCLVYVDSL
jgi:hypothetical protein